MVDNPAKPHPPTELQRRGRAFWRRTWDVYRLSAHETELLREICRCLDSLDRLAVQVATDGEMIEGNGGRMRLHPAVSASASLRLVLARLLERLGLPDEDGVAAPSTASVKAVKANSARWSTEAAQMTASAAGSHAAYARWHPRRPDAS